MSTRGKRAEVWISRRMVQGSHLSATWVSVRPIAQGRSRGSSRQAKSGERRIRTSPAQGKAKPPRIRTWRPSVATTSWLLPAGLEQEAAQGIAGVVVGRGRGRLGQGGEQVGRDLGPGGGQVGKRGDLVDRRDRVLVDLGVAPVGPADDGPVGGDGVEGQDRVVAALDLGEGVERQGGRAADGQASGVACSIARCAYRYRARSWPSPAVKTMGATGPRWAIPRTLRRRTARRAWAWRRRSVIMREDLQEMA